MTDARVGHAQVDVALLPASPVMRVGSVQLDVAYIYSGPPSATGPTVTVWNGTVEVAATSGVWTGSAEVAATIEIAP